MVNFSGAGIFVAYSPVLLSVRIIDSFQAFSGGIIMRLNFDEIKRITVGAVNIEQREDGIHFFKCTDKQTKAFYAFNDTLGMRSLTTTGIRLDFHTNSGTLAFRMPTGGVCDLLIDGLFRAQYKAGEGGAIKETVALTDPIGANKDTVRVTLAFPSHQVGTLDYIELDDGATVTPHKFDKKILFMGDSITQGHKTSCDTRSFAWLISNHYNADSVINGIGGAFFHTSIVDKSDFDPEWVFVAYGTNDWGRYPNDDDMLFQVRGFLDLVKEAYGDKKVFVISPIWRAKDSGEVMGERFHMRRRAIEAEAAARGFIPVDGLKLVPPVAACYSDTYLHPNDLGFSYYYENLRKIIDASV